MKKLLAVVAVVLVITPIISLELNSPTESLLDELFLFVGSETEYAAGYSHESFHQVRAGDSEARVYGLLGPPLRTDVYEDGSKVLIYSSAKGSIHRRRDILIKHKTVRKVFAEAFFD
jgi:hypothetical protein